MPDTSLVQRQIVALSPESDAEAAANAWLAVEALGRAHREIKAQLERQLIEWIDANGDLTVGEELRLYVGREKTTKCFDPVAALDVIVRTSAGDIEKVGAVLSANPFKPAAVRKLIGPELFEAYFDEQVKPDLLTGKPLRSLKALNPKFLPRPSADQVAS